MKGFLSENAHRLGPCCRNEGAPPTDRAAVVDVILRLAQLALDCPEVQEIEINPMIVMRPGGAIAVDNHAPGASLAGRRGVGRPAGGVLRFVLEGAEMR
ncbi:MAG: acetate--CoA ligase family protein [Chloroflexia bacterium]